MITENELANKISIIASDPKDVPPEIPASPEETPVTIPKDDPEVIITSLQDYDNSLTALLSLNALSIKDTPGD